MNGFEKNRRSEKVEWNTKKWDGSVTESYRIQLTAG